MSINIKKKALNVKNGDTYDNFDMFFLGDVGEAVDDWFEEHPEAVTNVADNSITAAKLAPSVRESVEEVTDLKSAIGTDNYSKNIDYGELITNEYIDTNSGAFEHYGGWNRTDYINVENCVDITINTDSNYSAFYRKNKVFLERVTFTNGVAVTIPENACYIAISSPATNMNSLEIIATVVPIVTIINSKINDVITSIPTESDIKNIADSKTKPYIVETKARYLWAYQQEPPIFTSTNPNYTEDGYANNPWFKINGTSGDSTVTVVSGGNASPSDISDYSKRWAGVISSDGVNYKPCVAWYVDSSTIGVYPPLSEDISGGELASMWVDNMHLTRRGYIGYVQAIFNANPKHCEKGSLINKYVPHVDNNPFTEIGSTMYYNVDSTFNYDSNGGFLYGNQFYRYYKRNSGSSPTTGKRGIAWTVPFTNKKSGYVEVMISGMGRTQFEIPQGNEIYIDIRDASGNIIDGYTKTSNILEDVCLDFEDSDSVTIEIYLTNQAPSSGNGSGFDLSSIHIWENQRNDESLFKKGGVVAQMFDSWGVFHGGATGKEFKRLLSEQAGVTVPFTNNSLGSQTSAWGRAWFFENIQKYHPKVGIVDFGINDSHSTTTSGWPETVDGPDGEHYNNIVTIENYIVNMQAIADYAKNNDIQIIMTGHPLPMQGEWYYALTENIH